MEESKNELPSSGEKRRSRLRSRGANSDDISSDPPPKIKHVLLSPTSARAKRKTTQLDEPDSKMKAAEVPEKANFDQYFHITRHSVADVVLRRVGKLDTNRLWDPDPTEPQGEQLAKASKSPAKPETDTPGRKEKDDSPLPAQANGPSDEQEPSDEDNDSIHAPRETKKIIWRSAVLPQSKIQVGSDVIVRSGSRKGFKGKLKQKISPNGYYLIRGGDGACTAHETEFELYRPEKRRRQASLWDQQKRISSYNGYIARSAFLAHLPNDDQAINEIARQAFAEAGFVTRKVSSRYWSNEKYT